MSTINLIVTFTHYSHSTNGMMSLSLKDTSDRAAMPESLRSLISEEKGCTAYMTLGEIGFKGALRSAVSRKKSLTLTIHVEAKRFLANRYFEMVGKSDLTLAIKIKEPEIVRRGEASQKREYLPRAEYEALRERVQRLLTTLSSRSDMDETAILFRATSAGGNDGVKTMIKMSPERLRELEGKLTMQLDYQPLERKESLLCT